MSETGPSDTKGPSDMGPSDTKGPSDMGPSDMGPSDKKQECHDEHCDHDHDKHEHCDHDHHHEEEVKTTGKTEKKVRKAIAKLGLTKMEGVNRVTMKQKDNYIIVVKDPEVYTCPQNENTFVIFGELTFDDPDKKLSQEAIEQMKKESEKMKMETEKANTQQKVEVIPEEGEVSEEGLDPEQIKTVMEEGGCTRQQAIKALRKHNNDVLEALLDIKG